MPGPGRRAGAAVAAGVAIALLSACGGGGGGGGPVGDPTYDLDALGVPQLVTTTYVALEGLTRISYFRSSDGHDYSDAVEHCRSMKHYFKVPDASTRVYAPVSGTVRDVFQEWAGTQVQIRADAQPAFVFIVFHLTPALALSRGTHVTAGQLLGTHVGSQTYSDIAVEVNTPRGRRLVSYFETLTDAAFAPFAARGAASRQAFIITRAQRDAAPLGCTGETFTGGADPYPIDTTF